jgi:hypothetical protein
MNRLFFDGHGLHGIERGEVRWKNISKLQREDLNGQLEWNM